MHLIEKLNWRYAVKRMNGIKIPGDQIEQVLEAIRLTASSGGLQPYRIVMIQNDEVKRKLQTASRNPQVAESSHLIVFAAFESVTQKHIDDYMKLIANVRNITLESLADFRKNLLSHFLSLSKEDSFVWASRQAYIALGTALIAAADLKIDAAPMEGFNPMQFDEILGLKEKELRSVVILALGYRDEKKDDLVNAKKVRLPKEELVSVIA